MSTKDVEWHWTIQNDRIQVDDGHGGLSQVAKIGIWGNDRSARQLLRYAHLGEQVEAIMDEYSSYRKEQSPEDVLQEILTLVRECIRLTSNQHVPIEGERETS